MEGDPELRSYVAFQDDDLFYLLGKLFPDPLEVKRPKPEQRALERSELAIRFSICCYYGIAFQLTRFCCTNAADKIHSTPPRPA